MTDKPFRPMLAGKADMATLTFPVLASPKIDGLRCLAMAGEPRSRSMKVLPNRHLQAEFQRCAASIEGLDGELMVGDPTAPDAFRTTTSAIMREDGQPDFRFIVFDRWDHTLPYRERFSTVQAGLASMPSWVQPLDCLLITSMAELDQYESEILAQGYEGVMLRSLTGPYKQGRSSTREGYLLKVKRYEDAEAEIVGFEEEMHNGNEAQTNEIGRTKRSSHQENLVGKGTMGALVVRGLNGGYAGVEFNIGTGFDAAQRREFWTLRDSLLGRAVTYKHFAVGAKDKPRHPVFKAFRDPMDFEVAA